MLVQLIASLKDTAALTAMQEMQVVLQVKFRQAASAQCLQTCLHLTCISKVIVTHNLQRHKVECKQRFDNRYVIL